MAEGINAARWPHYIHELSFILQRGGWLQLVELHLLVQSSSGQLAAVPCLTQWWEWYSEAMIRTGKNPRIARDLAGLLTREGLSGVESRIIPIPIGDWREGSIVIVTCIGRRRLTIGKAWPPKEMTSLR